MYAVGGLDDSTCFDTVERYDIEHNTWSTVASMSTPRGGVAVAALKVSRNLQKIFIDRFIENDFRVIYTRVEEMTVVHR